MLAIDSWRYQTAHHYPFFFLPKEKKKRKEKKVQRYNKIYLLKKEI